jgi:predicted nucleic acid-binding protein
VIVVVADTSPLNYLIQIHGDHVLPALYARVFVPEAVVDELRHPHAVAAVRGWLTRVPPWLLVQHVEEASDARLARLDLGERQAIQLATREHADLLLMDEKLGVRIAREQGLAVTGTLGVLLQAAKRGLLDLEQALAELQGTDFRCSRRVIEEVRRLARASSDG